MLPVLKDARVISGKQGLCRVVQFIDIMEVSDIDGWLREGELLLTTAYSLRNDLSKLPKGCRNARQGKCSSTRHKTGRIFT